MSYRAVVRHVRYWRGNPHRWSTVYAFEGTPVAAISTADCQTVFDHDSAMCWPGADTDGGPYECQFYDRATGGVPIATYSLFDHTSPSAWIAPTGTAWVPGSGSLNAAAESALLVEWRAGFSKTGKPVNLRKWYHMVPEAPASGASPQIGAGNLARLQAAAEGMIGMLSANGLTLGSGTGRFAGLASVNAFYGNHQMPRGRKRKVTSKALLAASELAKLQLWLGEHGIIPPGT